MATLAVNVDHVATLRQARLIDYPDPVEAAFLAESGGAEAIVIHLREDRRHIQDRDLRILRQTVKTRLNLEMAATAEMKAISLEVKPDMVTLVPEGRHELTTEGGLEVAGARDVLGPYISDLQAGGIQVSLFVDADQAQVQAAFDLGAEMVEIHTGHYADAKSEGLAQELFDNIAAMARFGAELGLGVHAGHGLNYHNIHRFAACPEIAEYAIGHSIVARAITVGLERAVQEMVDLVRFF